MNGSALEPSRLARALVDAARAELALTPKPGLVDRRDNGSHPDLSFELMSRSIDLLPQYFEELLAAGEGIRLKPDPTGRGLTDGIRLKPDPTRNELTDGIRLKPDPTRRELTKCIAAGRRAEERMAAAIGSNAHRGYIFLSGLVLLATAPGVRDLEQLRSGVADLAARILAHSPQHGEASATNGATVRRRLSVGGIHAEALAGLPSVFDHGIPAYERALARFGATARAQHLLMASLMTVVEDTTALHRCGPEGLRRLRDDGRVLGSLIESGRAYLPFLETLNDDYRSVGLTMGGVADCMAVTMALLERA